MLFTKYFFFLFQTTRLFGIPSTKGIVSSTTTESSSPLERPFAKWRIVREYPVTLRLVQKQKMSNGQSTKTLSVEQTKSLGHQTAGSTSIALPRFRRLGRLVERIGCSPSFVWLEPETVFANTVDVDLFLGYFCGKRCSIAAKLSLHCVEMTCLFWPTRTNHPGTRPLIRRRFPSSCCE